jgi:hypothetical protein
MTDRVQAWQCIGCGKLEASQPCIGICEDRKVEFVYAFEHDDVVSQLGAARRQVETLRALVRQLAHSTPRNGEWERSYLALQAKAKRMLADAPASSG